MNNELTAIDAVLSTSSDLVLFPSAAPLPYGASEAQREEQRAAVKRTGDMRRQRQLVRSLFLSLLVPVEDRGWRGPHVGGRWDAKGIYLGWFKVKNVAGWGMSLVDLLDGARIDSLQGYFEKAGRGDDGAAKKLTIQYALLGKLGKHFEEKRGQISKLVADATGYALDELTSHDVIADAMKAASDPVLYSALAELSALQVMIDEHAQAEDAQVAEARWAELAQAGRAFCSALELVARWMEREAMGLRAH